MTQQRTFISIEGNIGSGKSTLLANLQGHLENDKTVVFLQEPVDEWETIRDINGKTMLQKFYENQKSYSFAFQMMAYISRLATLKKAIEDHPNATIFITERSLDTDKYVFAQMLFDDDKMEDVHFQIYTRWLETFSKEFPMTKRVYVKTEPDICHTRIITRSRTGESSISLDYLMTCHHYHESMLRTTNASVLELNGNADIFEHKEVLDEWIQSIITFATLHD